MSIGSIGCNGGGSVGAVPKAMRAVVSQIRRCDMQLGHLWFRFQLLLLSGVGPSLCCCRAESAETGTRGRP